jgi:hypothetical protein
VATLCWTTAKFFLPSQIIVGRRHPADKRTARRTRRRSYAAVDAPAAATCHPDRPIRYTALL